MNDDEKESIGDEELLESTPPDLTEESNVLNSLPKSQAHL